MIDALGRPGSILVLGGTSEIGLAIARHLATPRRAPVVLAGRNLEALGAEAQQLSRLTGGKVSTLAFDALATHEHPRVIEQASDLVGDLDVVVVAFGVLGDQTRDYESPGSAELVARTNYVAGVTAGLASAHRLEQQGHGVIVFLSSVAGERVRKANFIYGSSKAGLDGFAQGLGDHLAGSGVRVLVVRPGFVTTKMTAGMPKAPLATSAEAVGKATAEAVAAGKELIWVPAALRPAFTVLRHLPRPIWRRLPL